MNARHVAHALAKLFENDGRMLALGIVFQRQADLADSLDRRLSAPRQFRTGLKIDMLDRRVIVDARRDVLDHLDFLFGGKVAARQHKHVDLVVVVADEELDVRRRDDERRKTKKHHADRGGGDKQRPRHQRGEDFRIGGDGAVERRRIDLVDFIAFRRPFGLAL